MTRSLLLAACVACQAPLTEVPPLPIHQGCGDVSLFAVSADGAVQIRFQAEGTLEAAYAGTPEFTWVATDPDITLLLERGRNLDQGNCTDVVVYEDGRPVVAVDETWRPTSGSVRLTLTPTGTTWQVCSAPADAVLSLEGVVFESPHGEELTVDTLDVAAGVGWCPG